jgi:putative DNA primase/helicase
MKMIDAALEYIQQGFSVFPCCWPSTGQCACGRNHQGRNIGKVPLTEHGLKDATCLEITVREYWTRWPDANIGGAISGDKFVLDNDREKNGYDSLGILQTRHGALTETRLHTTGNLGQHYIYSTQVPIRNTVRVDGLDGLDIRGYGGYIILPPSLHRTGNRYVLSHVWDGPVMPAPAWLVELCTRKNVTTWANTVTDNPIREGSRNDNLARDAGVMRRRGLSESAINAALQVENRERCQPPLTEEEVSRIAKSVGRYLPADTQLVRFRGGVVL